jgi:lipoprotein-releasing system ATP-binding protein
MPNINKYILNFQKVSHKFKQGKSIINVLNSVNFKLKNNCIAALVGSSGSGKSTFLHLAGLLESPNKGKIYINNKIVSKLDNSARTKLRRNSLGFVYQKIYLLPEFTALENVMIPQLIMGINKMEAINQAKIILSSMGLKNRLNHRPSSLSGGEQQRVAIARAIINKPNLILADEPTGNLDSSSSNLISKILLQSIRGTKASAIIATHSLELAKKCDLIYKIDNGEIF